MSGPRLTRDERGALVLRSIPGVLAYALRRLPDLLADGAPGIERRVAPSPHPDDDEASEEWARHAGPELRHLFVSARAVVLEDLEGLRPEDPGRTFRLEIPAGHEPAWLSALAAARVALGDAHGITAADMARPLEELVSVERDHAIYLVHLLGWLQGFLVQAAEAE